jgi:crotonobetainyl-CoA:carnitine CoA-transferase CaiB-like acyl-CoA transferase
VSEGLSGAFAGLILASLGHEVVQVRSGVHRALDALESGFYDRQRIFAAEAGALGRLLPLADLLVTDLHPRRMKDLGLPRSEDELSQVGTGLVEVAITSFGLSGPHADYAMCDLTDWAAGGLSYLTRRSVPREDVEHYSPVLPPGRQPELLGGLVGALAALAALRLARQTGRSTLADVSRQEVLASMSHSYLPMLVHNLMLLGTPENRVGYGWLLPASDGEVYLRTVEISQWDRLVEWMGNPDWATRRPDDLPIYYGAQEIVGPLLAEWTKEHSQDWLLEEAARWRVPMAPTREIAEVLDWPHLHERGVWAQIELDGRIRTAPRLPLLGPVGASRHMDSESLVDRWSPRP